MPEKTSSMMVRIVTKQDALIVQAVHRYGYSQGGCRFSGPALRYGQPVGKQALIQEARPDPRCDPRWRLEEPLRSEPQEGNRYRFWGKIEEFKGRVLRVTTLEDKITIHNAFPDRGFKP